MLAAIGLAAGCTAPSGEPEPGDTTAQAATGTSTAAASPAPTTLPSPHESVTFTDGVRYGSEPEQLLDVFAPTSDVPSPTGTADRRPAIVVVHGGGWTTGDRSANYGLAAGLAARGWVVVSPGYRLAPAHPHPAAEEDVRAALRHVHDHAGQLDVDPQRVVLSGYSAGGHLAGLVALDDDRPPVAAWVSWSGAYDLSRLSQRLAGTEHEWLTDHVADYLACAEPAGAACRDRAQQASPVARASQDDPPTMLVHATDEFIPLAGARQMRRALVDAGVRTDLETVEGEAHGAQLMPASADALTAFLVDVLDLETSG